MYLLTQSSYPTHHVSLAWHSVCHTADYVMCSSYRE